MFRESYQRGIFTLMSSTGSKPLDIWEKHVKDGNVSRFLDPEIKSLVVELRGNNVSTTYISCPKGKTVLGITMPFLVMIVRNLHKYFAFEVTILDASGVKRRFRVGNFQTTTTISPTCTVMPICLEPGWNQIHFNLADFTKRAYNKHYMEILTIKINANIRLRKVYFTDRIFSDEELPDDFKLFFPAAGTKNRERKRVDSQQDKENIAPETPLPELITPQKPEPDMMDFPAFRRRRSSSSIIAAKKEPHAENPRETLKQDYHAEDPSEILTVIKPISKESIPYTPRQVRARSKASTSELSPPRKSTTKIAKHTGLLSGKHTRSKSGSRSTQGSQQLVIEAPIGSPKGKYNILVDALNVKDERPIL